MLNRSIVIATALLLIAAGVNAQVEARQGTEEDLPNEFESPMILDLPLPHHVLEWERGQGKSYGDSVHEYICEDVSIRTLTISQAKIKKSESHRRLNVDGRLYVRPSHDRAVDLRFEIVSGDDVLAHATRRNLDAEENKFKPFKDTLKVEPAALEAALSAEEPPVLRVTMSVRKD